MLRQLSLTTEDRRALESEMKEQLRHPLNQQMEQEAEERRILSTCNRTEFYGFTKDRAEADPPLPKRA